MTRLWFATASRFRLSGFRVIIGTFTLLALIVIAGLLAQRGAVPEAVFGYRGPDGALARGGIVTYTAVRPALCADESLQWTVALDIIQAPTLLTIRGAIRERTTGRTRAAFDLNQAISQGHIQSPIPYAKPRRFPAVPLTMPLAEHKLPPGDYVLEAVGGDRLSQFSGFAVDFEVRDDC